MFEQISKNSDMFLTNYDTYLAKAQLEAAEVNNILFVMERRWPIGY